MLSKGRYAVAVTRDRQQGFTLVEVIIAAVIIAILSAVAYPAYMDNVVRANRTDARAVLTRLANEMERSFATNGQYPATLAGFGLMEAGDAYFSDNGHYVLTIAAGPSGSLQTSYALSADPVEDGPQAHDETCPSYSLNSQGRRLPDAATTECW